MATRTFGWIQNPSSTASLRNILGLFIPGSDFHKYMVNKKLPLLQSANLFKTSELFMEFQKVLRANKPIPYDVLKGQGSGENKRSEAKCSGLAQAALTGQQKEIYNIGEKTIEIKKPYADDWTTDGFLRWAVSLGFLDYDYSNDTCCITSLGVSFVNAPTKEEQNDILGQAYLSYPPVCRVLGLLATKGHLTKFEIGSQLGFTDEAGFTSFPQNIWVQAYEETTDKQEKAKIRANSEGSSDKYARMICRWLIAIGWVKNTPKTVIETLGLKTYTCVISSAYEITDKGLANYNRAIGNTNSPRIPKIVYRDMLASKVSDAKYLRMRRSLILLYLRNHKKRTIEDIVAFLNSNGLDEKCKKVKDDMKGLINIGLDIDYDGVFYKLNDKIKKLTPYDGTVVRENSDAAIIKDRVRLNLQNIDHKYLTLIDYAFSGKDKSGYFEVYTIDLLVNELAFTGMHLGGTRKPDGIFSHEQNGVIIDNKAYSKGFTITRSMADEMVRYVQENKERNPKRNTNQWWLNFDENVSHFNFVFISSLFKGEVEKMLENIKQSTDVEGCVLTAENLLYFADAIKGGDIQKTEFMSMFGAGKEIVCPINRV